MKSLDWLWRQPRGMMYQDLTFCWPFFIPARMSLWRALILLLICLGQTAFADIICQWNFNSSEPDGDTATGTLSPAVGGGTAGLIGGVIGSFTSGATPDPATSDDSAWSTRDYAWTTYSNRTAGVQFMASTAGFEEIKVSWAQMNSTTASRYMRLQYTLDGTTFLDFAVIGVMKENSYTNFNYDLSAIAGATNNPLFGIRLLAEFESTAVGGMEGYVATGHANYDPDGTIKLDMVTISGKTIGDNNTSPYIIGSVPDQVLPANGVSMALPFSVLDAEDPATNLVVRPTSSNPAVLPLDNITVGGLGANRTVTVGAAGVTGSSMVSLWVVDTGGKSNSLSFNVTCLPANSSPVISGLVRVNMLAGGLAGPIPFGVHDAETPAADLQVSASAANSLLVPESGVVLGGTGTNRTMTISPVPGRSGVTPITVSVSDGENVTSAFFPLMVSPSPGLIFFEPFDYPQGPVTTNSALLWSRRSGTYGDCVVSNAMLRLSQNCSEDIAAQLIGAPYDPGTGVVLYVSFKVQALALPKVLPATFAHFVVGNTLVGKISAGTTNAVEGTYRLFVGNGPDETPVTFPMSMNLKISYQVVVKYEVDAARTTLWVDPANEGAFHVTATDEADPGRISSFCFRQHDGIGAGLMIDDLRAGLSFAAVTDPGAAPFLGCDRVSGGIRLSWDNPSHKLQSSPAVSGPYTNVTGASSPWDVSADAPAAFFRLRAD